MIETIPRIGDEVYIHGYIDEIRKDIIIIRNEGGYFGTVFNEVIVDRKTESDPETPNTCETCRYEGECDWKQWQKCYCEPEVRSNLEPFRVDEPQCEECGHWEHGAGDHYYCALLEMRQECYFESKNESTLMFANEPKTEPEVRSNLEPFRVDEPQTCANGCKWLNQDGECTEPSGVCHIEYRTEVDEPQTDCAWGGGCDEDNSR